MNPTRKILKAQKIRSYLIIGGCSLLLWGIAHFMFQEMESSSSLSKHPIADLPVDKVNVQDIWMNRHDKTLARLESENQLSEKRMKMLEDLILSQTIKEEEIEREKIEAARNEKIDTFDEKNETWMIRQLWDGPDKR